METHADDTVDDNEKEEIVIKRFKKSKKHPQDEMTEDKFN